MSRQGKSEAPPCRAGLGGRRSRPGHDERRAERRADGADPARLPLKRIGQAREIAEAVAFLLSSKASYVTGQSLAVDGGMQL